MNAKRERRIREAVAICIDRLIALQHEGGAAPDRPTARILNTLNEHDARLRHPPPQVFAALTLPEEFDQHLDIAVSCGAFAITVRVSLRDFGEDWRAIPFGAEPTAPDDAFQARLDDLLEASDAQRRAQADEVPPLPDAPAERAEFGAGRLLPDDPHTRRSRFGGVPFLPADHGWPRSESGRPLHFLAQVDLREAPPNEQLPDSGLLSFFADPEGDAHEVVHVHAATELVRIIPPADTPDDFVRPCAGIRFTSEGSLHRLLGEPDAIQYDPREGDWQLLLQLDAGEPLDFDFFDSGRLYFLFRAGRWDETQLVLQSY